MLSVSRPSIRAAVASRSRSTGSSGASRSAAERAVNASDHAPAASAAWAWASAPLGGAVSVSMVEAVLDGEQGRLGAVAGVDLGQDGAHVALDRPDAQVERRRD